MQVVAREGQGVGSLPSDFAQRDIVNAPLKWLAYFIDTMTLDKNDEGEEALSDLDFTPAFFMKLK